MDTLEPGMSIVDENNGRGTFIGWFQGSVDIAIIMLRDGRRIVVHKRFLTKHYDEPIKKVEIALSADKLRTITKLYVAWSKSPAMTLRSDRTIGDPCTRSRLETRLDDLLESRCVTSSDIEDGAYSFVFEELRFARS